MEHLIGDRVPDSGPGMELVDCPAPGHLVATTT